MLATKSRGSTTNGLGGMYSRKSTLLLTSFTVSCVSLDGLRKFKFYRDKVNALYLRAENDMHMLSIGNTTDDVGYEIEKFDHQWFEKMDFYRMTVASCNAYLRQAREVPQRFLYICVARLCSPVYLPLSLWLQKSDSFASPF